MRSDPGVDRAAGLVDRRKLQLLRNDVLLAQARMTTVLDAMLKKEDRGNLRAIVGVVDQDCSLFHELIVLVAYDADDGFQQRMPGVNEGRDRLLVDLALLEADAFVLLLDRSAGTDLPIPFTDADRDMRDLPPPFLAWLELAAELLKGLDKETLNMVRLQTLRFGLLPFEAQ